MSPKDNISVITDCQENFYIWIHDWHLITGALKKH